MYIVQWYNFTKTKMKSFERKWTLCRSVGCVYSVRASHFITVYATQTLLLVMWCIIFTKCSIIYTGNFASGTPTISYWNFWSCTFSIPAGMYAYIESKDIIIQTWAKQVKQNILTRNGTYEEYTLHMYRYIVVNTLLQLMYLIFSNI